jgi:CheY-like chemotaxis protein
MILLVEDNEDDVFIMERVMLKLPLRLNMHVAVDGRQAVDYLQGSGKYSDRLAYPIPSLIFLDLKLPILHGFEVLEWINTQLVLKNVPVAILSSSAEPRDRETAIRLGAKTFLVKPPTPETVGQVLKLFSTPGHQPNS